MKNENIQKLTRIRDLLAQGTPVAQYLAADIDSILASEECSLFGLMPSEVSSIKSGHFIEAVKSVRSRKGMTLSDAKNFTEEAGIKLGLRNPETGWLNNAYAK